MSNKETISEIVIDEKKETVQSVVMVTIIQKMDEIDATIKEVNEQIQTATKLKEELEKQYKACAEFIQKHEMEAEHG